MNKLKKLALGGTLILSGLTILFFGLVLVANFMWPVSQPPQISGVVSKQKTDQQKPLKTSSIDINVLFNETNQARSKNGLARLSLNPGLNDSATDKCLDLVRRDYWSHNAPDGVKPWTFIEHHVDNYSAAGENLAYGFDSAAETVEGWMASSGHRKNIVDKHYTDVGFGVCKSDDYVGQGQKLIIVQHFISR